MRRHYLFNDHSLHAFSLLVVSLWFSTAALFDFFHKTASIAPGVAVQKQIR